MSQLFAMRTRHPRFFYGTLLALAAAIWGFATVVIKDVVYDIGPFWLVALRLSAAGLVLAAVFKGRIARAKRAGRLGDHLRAGAILGLFTAAAYLSNTYGLVYTTAAKSSFLTATYVVLTPFLAWAWVKARPHARNLVAAVVCIIGIACITLNGMSGIASDASGAAALVDGVTAPASVTIAGFSMGWGDAITLVSAVMYAFEVTGGSVLAPKRDIAVITATQFLVAGAIALIAAIAFEAPPAWEVVLAPRSAVGLVYLVLAGTCLTMLLQNKGLANVDASLGSLLLSTESVFGAVFAVMFLGEALTAPMVIGFALVFAAVVISECTPAKRS